MFMLSTGLNSPGRGPARHHAAPLPHFPTRNQLMEESERRLSHAASSGIPEDQLIADRLLGSTRLYIHWQSEHDAILGRVIAPIRRRAREATLLSAAFGLIHRKALFEYLLAAKLRGEERVLFVSRFFGHHDYRRTMIVEHGNYLRSAASFLCLTHIGARVLRNPLFDMPLAHYEELYGDYFFTVGETALQKNDDPLFGYSRTMAKSLKRQVELRRTILLRSALEGLTADSPEPEYLRRQ